MCLQHHSQNHRTAEAGRSFLLKQGHLEQAAQDCIQRTFECLQGENFSLPGPPVPMLSHSHGHSHSMQVYSDVKMFQFVPIASGSTTVHH